MTLLRFFILLALIPVLTWADVSDYDNREKKFCDRYLKTGNVDCGLSKSAPEDLGQETFLIYCNAELARLQCNDLRSIIKDTSALKECTPDKICLTNVEDFDLLNCGKDTGKMLADQFLGTFERAWEDHQLRGKCATDPKMKMDMIENYNKNEFIPLKFKITDQETMKLASSRNCDQIQAIILARGRAAIEDWNSRARAGDPEALKKIRAEQMNDRILAALKVMKVRTQCYTPKALAELSCAVGALTAVNVVIGAGTARTIKNLAARFGLSPADVEAALASSTQSKVDASAGRPNLKMSVSDNLDGTIIAEKKSYARYKDKWETMTADEKAAATKEMTETIKKDLEATGFKVRTEMNPDGTYKIVIDDMPGRSGEFYGRVQSIYGDTQARIVYDPAAMILENGSGAAYDRVAHTVTVDTVALRQLANGDVTVLKHELRHSRQAALEDQGVHNQYHGQAIYGESAPRSGLYGKGAQVDELLTYRKQLPDSARAARKLIGEIEKNPQLLKTQAGVNRYKAVLGDLDQNYHNVTSIARGIDESGATIQKGLNITGRPVTKMVDGHPVHHFNTGPEAVTIEFFQNDKVGKNGVMGITFPAVRNGKTVKTAAGTVEQDLYVIPVSPNDFEKFKGDALAARQYVISRMQANRNAASEARRYAVDYRSREIDPLIERLRELGRGK